MLPRPVFPLPLPAPPGILANPYLSAGAKLAWIAIATASNDAGLCTASLNALRSVVGMPRSTFYRALDELVEAGGLAPLRQDGKTHWLLLVPAMPDPAKTESWPIPSQAQHVPDRDTESVPDRDAEAVPNRDMCQIGTPDPMNTMTSPEWPGEAPVAVAEVVPPLDPPLSPPPAPPPLSPPIIPPSLRQRGQAPHRLPEDWQPDGKALAYLRDHCPLVEPGRETARFVFYWREGKGRTQLRSNWGMAFRNWMDRAQEDAANRRAGSPGRPLAGPGDPPRSAGMDALRRMIEESGE